MKRSLSSLRGRVALVATGAVAAVLILVGIAAVTAFSDRESERIDRDLAARSAPARSNLYSNPCSRHVRSATISKRRCAPDCSP